MDFYSKGDPVLVGREAWLLIVALLLFATAAVSLSLRPAQHGALV